MLLQYKGGINLMLSNAGPKTVAIPSMKAEKLRGSGYAFDLKFPPVFTGEYCTG